MLDAEEARLSRLYQALRERLLDLSKRNQLLNYRFSARSKRFVQVVDGSLEAIYGWLVSEEPSLRIKPLPEPDEIPRDERTDEFRAALDHAKVTDVEYLAALEALEATGRSDEIEVAKIEKSCASACGSTWDFLPVPYGGKSIGSTTQNRWASTRTLN